MKSLRFGESSEGPGPAPAGRSVSCRQRQDAAFECLRIPLLLLVIAFTCLSAFGQEVVVFKDHRSLVVSAHRQSGAWTYLNLDGGEMAVMTSSISEVRNEGPAAAEAAQAAKAVVTDAAQAQEEVMADKPQEAGYSYAPREPASTSVQEPARPPFNPAASPFRPVGMSRTAPLGMTPMAPGGQKR